MTYVESAKSEKDRLSSVLERERQTAQAVKRLESELETEKKDFQTETKDAKTKIAELKEKLHDLRAKLNVRC